MALNLDRISARIAHRLRAIVAEETVPVRSGELRRSIHVSKRGDGYLVGTNKIYARAIHEGRPQMVVRPKRAKAMKFKVGGKYIYRKKAVLKKIEGRPFFKQALDKFTANASKELDAIVPDLSKDLKNLLAYELRNINLQIRS